MKNKKGLVLILTTTLLFGCAPPIKKGFVTGNYIREKSSTIYESGRQKPYDKKPIFDFPGMLFKFREGSTFYTGEIEEISLEARVIKYNYSEIIGSPEKSIRFPAGCFKHNQDIIGCGFDMEITNRNGNEIHLFSQDIYKPYDDCISKFQLMYNIAEENKDKYVKVKLLDPNIKWTNGKINENCLHSTAEWYDGIGMYSSDKTFRIHYIGSFEIEPLESTTTITTN